MSLEILERPLKDRKVRWSLSRILERNFLCAVATVTPRGEAYNNTAYFAYTPDLDFYFYSFPDTQHALNLRTHRSMAMAIFDSGKPWGRPDRGLQLFGSGRAAQGRSAREAERVYDRRFPGHAYWKVSSSTTASTPSPRPFRFRPTTVKLLDESAFGAGVFVRTSVPRQLTAHERLPPAPAGRSRPSPRDPA